MSAKTPDEFIGAIRSLIRSAGPRVAGADPEQLANLIRLHEDLDRSIRFAVAGQRASGVTWRSIGDATGTTPEAALIKWKRSTEEILAELDETLAAARTR